MTKAITAQTLTRWWPQRLSSRIVVLFLGLLLVVQLAGLALVQWSITRNAGELLAQDLQVGERLWNRLLVQRAARLTLGASVLAADYGFRSATASGDMQTLSSALDNHGQRIGATVTAMFTPTLQPQAMGESADRSTLQALQALAPQLAKQGSTLALLGGKPFQLVMVPMKAPQLVGYVVMGFALDQSLVDDMQALSDLHVSLLIHDAGGAERVALSTLPKDLIPGLLGQARGAQLKMGEDETYVFRSIQQIGDGTAQWAGLRTLLLRSLAEKVAPYQPLKATLAALTLAGLLVAGVTSVFITRQMTGPLHSLVKATEYMGSGDFSRALKHAERNDEIGDLSRAFEQMRVSIASHEQAIRQLAYWDRLTGLPNRAQFRDTVRAAITEASLSQTGNNPQPIAVVMLDLDRFKHVNDVLGYAFGDRLLKGVAERLLRMSVREGDVVARLSGDEFALLLPGSDEAAAVAVAERVADIFQLPMTMDDHTVDLAAGFGVACWPAHAADADTLINRAEVAMYNAKRKSGAPQVYDPHIDASSARSLSLLSELRRALENDELRLFLQPKIALESGRFAGAEALVRWQHPQRGMVPPMDFIPFAEQTGFVRHLTLWMVEATARQWATLAGLGLSSVSVNLSTRDLMDAELPAKINRILRRHGMPPKAMCLEITESAIMDEPQRALATLNALSAAGFKLSIDDFGTGYSSLAYLKRLPVNELKIDRSFVMAMEKDIDDAKIVRSTIDLAHNLGLTVVAEGVENPAVLELLAELGCDEAQGYHMSRPLPANEMAAFAARWNERSPQAH
jgi:diguanylate cyclase (GGDEF)-like protein